MAATDTTVPKQRTNPLRSDAAQKLLAFAGLIVLFIVFSFLSPYFLTFDNVIGILLATAVNGVLALGVTFVIITGGIDRPVGTVMTLAAVMILGLAAPMGAGAPPDPRQTVAPVPPSHRLSHWPRCNTRYRSAGSPAFQGSPARPEDAPASEPPAVCHYTPV